MKGGTHELAKEMEGGETLTPLSSKTSRTTHSSKLSPISLKPASVEYRPCGHAAFLHVYSVSIH